MSDGDYMDMRELSNVFGLSIHTVRGYVQEDRRSRARWADEDRLCMPRRKGPGPHLPQSYKIGGRVVFLRADVAEICAHRKMSWEKAVARQQSICELTRERDEARAEVERLRVRAVHLAGWLRETAAGARSLGTAGAYELAASEIDAEFGTDDQAGEP